MVHTLLFYCFVYFYISYYLFPTHILGSFIWSMTTSLVWVLPLLPDQNMHSQSSPFPGRCPQEDRIPGRFKGSEKNCSKGREGEGGRNSCNSRGWMTDCGEYRKGRWKGDLAPNVKEGRQKGETCWAVIVTEKRKKTLMRKISRRSSLKRQWGWIVCIH